ncbi:probable pectinesterase/pectinesterase inhibitor 36 [Cucumis sativus]|uniref:Pectinesterase n=1 Tax=Cucumis sativus TaxID=3659 RepID=A0A0A0L3U7_CUCSA|nr:probable pectinesterase/pectinesterase inhibitor 36 [Cucumis sativus]
MPFPFTTFLLLLFLPFVASSNFSLPALDSVRLAQTGVREAITEIGNLKRRQFGDWNLQAALRDCATLYEEAEWRLAGMLVGENKYRAEDGRMWVSAAMANHRSCLDGLEEVHDVAAVDGNNLTVMLTGALHLYDKIAAVEKRNGRKRLGKRKWRENRGTNLATWNPATSKANYVVAKDGSGTHRTINRAVAALARSGRTRRGGRIVIYVKAGVYRENVEIGIQLKNVMLVGDGIDKTIVTGSRNVPDGATTYNSATFGVSGDGFWVRDITFENTAGPGKQQAVALRLNSDLAVVYRCAIKGYQDTLFLHSLRQFYRDCKIYGTIDFIFGNSAAVLQNCEIFVRQPILHQANMITAQGRDDPAEATGFSILNSRVQPAPEFSPVKAQYRTYLGRPWKRFSRTVVIATDLDGLIDPKGWGEWTGDFAISTLFYAEFKNRGDGSSTRFRVNWPGFHILRSAEEARPFTVAEFLHGGDWIPATGVPFEAGV